jgi:hypothetical protein
MSRAVIFLEQQGIPGSVPGMSDVAATIIGTVLALVVIYAIVAANLRKED